MDAIVETELVIFCHDKVVTMATNTNLLNSINWHCINIRSSDKISFNR